MTRDRDNTLDRRLAGIAQAGGAGTQHHFQVDLPAAGDYQIWFALGDAGSQSYEYCQIKDGATALYTLDDSTFIAGGLLWDDTAGTRYNQTTWSSSNVPTTLTFTGSTFTFVLGPTTANNSTLSHLFISQVVAAAVLPRSRVSMQQRRG